MESPLSSQSVLCNYNECFQINRCLPEQVPNTESTCLFTVKTITCWSVPLGQTKHILMVSCLCAVGVFCQLQLIDLWGFWRCFCVHVIHACCLWIMYLCPWTDLSISVWFFAACVYVVCLRGHSTENLCVYDCQSLILVWQPAALSDAWLAG